MLDVSGSDWSRLVLVGLNNLILLATDARALELYNQARRQAAMNALEPGATSVIGFTVNQFVGDSDGFYVVADSTRRRMGLSKNYGGQCFVIDPDTRQRKNVTGAWVSPDGGTVAVRFERDPKHVLVFHRGDTQGAHEAFSKWRDALWHGNHPQDRQHRLESKLVCTMPVTRGDMRERYGWLGEHVSILDGVVWQRACSVKFWPLRRGLVAFSVLAWSMPMIEHDDAFAGGGSFARLTTAWFCLWARGRGRARSGWSFTRVQRCRMDLCDCCTAPR